MPRPTTDLRRLALPAALTLALAASGCGGSSGAEPVTGATTTAPVTTGSSSSGPVTFSDKKGDGPAPGLDIVEGSVDRRDGQVVLGITLAAPPATGGLFAAGVFCGPHIWQLSLLHGAAKDVASVTNIATRKRSKLDVAVEGRTVTMRAPAAKLRCGSGPFSVSLQSADGRKPTAARDSAPQTGQQAFGAPPS